MALPSEFSEDWEARYIAWKKAKDKKKESLAVFPDEQKKEERKEPTIEEIIETSTAPQVKKEEFHIPLPKPQIAILISVFLILFVVGFIVITNYNPSKVRYNPVDIEIKKSGSLTAQVFYQDKPFIAIHGWESLLNLNGKKDRLYGKEQQKKIIFDEKGKAYTYTSTDEKIIIEPLKEDPSKATREGWFVESDTKDITILPGKKTKLVSISLSHSDKRVSLDYTVFKEKPYFTSEISIQHLTSNESEKILGYFAYGYVAQGYDVYLPNGTILKNDNQIIKTNKSIGLSFSKEINESDVKNLESKLPNEIDLSKQAIQRKGSTYEINNIEYQMLINNESRGFLIFTESERNTYENIFAWNIHRVYIYPNELGFYPKVYTALFENLTVEYKENDWEISSKQFKGKLKEYISQIKKETSEILAT